MARTSDSSFDRVILNLYMLELKPSDVRELYVRLVSMAVLESCQKVRNFSGLSSILSFAFCMHIREKYGKHEVHSSS